MKRFMLGSIAWYQRAFAYRLSPCRFYPSCSVYAREAIESFGPLKGCLLAVRRLSRCRPFGPSGYDPVPETHVCREHSRTNSTEVTREHV